MLFKSDITNARIIVNTLEGNQKIADTYIKRFNSSTDIGILDADNFRGVESQKVSALVFSRDGLMECNGTIRNTPGLEIEICFYQTNEKNDRGATRYDVNMMGNVTAVLKKVTGEILKDTFPCKVVNMSATGVLISGPSQRLKVGDVPSISAFKDGHRLRIVCEVVRVHDSNVQTEMFGCKIVKLVSG